MKKFCPTCRSEIEILSSNNPHRPFCSERCRLIDLGDWLNEKHKVADITNKQQPIVEKTPTTRN